MEYYIEIYKKIVCMIDDTNKDIASIKEEISEYQRKINLYEKEISDKRDGIIAEIEWLEDREKNYHSSLNLLSKCKSNMRSSIYFILFSSFFMLLCSDFFYDAFISNISLACFLAISIPCSLNIICKYIRRIFIKKSISKFDLESNRRMLNLLEEKLNDIDIGLIEIYTNRAIFEQKLSDARTELNAKQINVKDYVEEKRNIENEIINYIRETASLSCDKNIEGQLFMDDVLTKKRKL